MYGKYKVELYGYYKILIIHIISIEKRVYINKINLNI